MCLCVCKGNDELRWQYRSIEEARSDLNFACHLRQLWQLCTCLVQYKAKMPLSMLQIDKRRVSFVIRSALIYNNFHSSQSQSTERAIKLEQVKTQQKFPMLQAKERERGEGRCSLRSVATLAVLGQSNYTANLFDISELSGIYGQATRSLDSATPQTITANWFQLKNS